MLSNINSLPTATDSFQAQEDAEVLRSLVEPLEEEIKALKEKLRSTDDDLQKYVGANNSSPVHSPTCSKCMEWELEASTKSQRVDTLDKQVVRLHEDLERESRLRGELEKEWQEKKEQHKAALTDLTEQLKKSEEQMFLLTVSDTHTFIQFEHLIKVTFCFPSATTTASAKRSTRNCSR